MCRYIHASQANEYIIKKKCDVHVMIKCMYCMKDVMFDDYDYMIIMMLFY